MDIKKLFHFTLARAGNVWLAAIGHGALNGAANIWLLFLATSTNPLIGPGVVGSAFFTLAVLIILWKAKS